MTTSHLNVPGQSISRKPSLLPGPSAPIIDERGRPLRIRTAREHLMMGIKKALFPVRLVDPRRGGSSCGRRRSAAETGPDPSPISQTQLTLRLNPLQGRATVIAIAERNLDDPDRGPFPVPGGRRENHP